MSISKCSLRRAAIAALAAVGISAGAAGAAERAIIVLDASGSMWGQIEGKAKISIARETLTQVLGRIPSDVELGLIAYGHRRKGECSDIELMVPSARGTAPAISNAVQGIKPKGKTPLSEAVRQAAEALKFTEDKATVILITDGLETCDADPCALARQLEETGVDFTAHVVGFGLSAEEGRQVACLAEETGGIYMPASNSDELVEALDRTVAAPPPPDPTATLTAEDRVPISRNFRITWEGPGATGDRIEIYDANDLQGGGVIRSVAPTQSSAGASEVEMPAPGRPGEYALRYLSAEADKVIAERPLTVVPTEVSVVADGDLRVGEAFDVLWTGPGMAGDRIELWDPAASGGNGRKLAETAVRETQSGERRVAMPAPDMAGELELRYWNGDNALVLATSRVTVEDIFASLEAPQSVEAASVIPVTWDGPGAPNDQIQLFDPDARNGEGRVLRKARVKEGDGKMVTLTAPATTGSYELRYYSRGGKRVLATRTIEVTETVVTLDHDEAVEAGARFTVTWEGPGAGTDRIELFDPDALNGEGKVLRYKQLRQGDYEARTVELVAPAEAGDYQVRYNNRPNRAIMATSDIAVTEVLVTLEFESPAAGGSTLTIVWDGPGARYDEVYIFDPRAKGGDGATFKTSRVRSADFENRSVQLPVPVKPGNYEVRYWNGDNKTVMASEPLEVIETPVTLDFTPEKPAGSTVEVAWDGPGARYDEVYIFDPRAKGGDGATFKTARVRSGDFDNRTVKLVVPAKPGDYEIRYWSGDSRTVMASEPLRVTEVTTSLDFPAEVPAGSTMEVKWDGPGARYDEVYIFDPRAKGGDGATFKTVRVRSGDFENQTVKLVVPAEPGEYEVRYWNGDSRAMLASAPLTVTEVKTGLEFPAEVPAGSTMTVKWDGPGAKYDEVHIFDPRAKQGKGATFRAVRVRSGDFDNRTVEIVVPAEPGTYEVRYWSGDSRAILASASLQVAAVPLGLEAPAQVGQGRSFDVTWQGPGARYDEIHVFDPTAKNGKGAVTHAVRVRSGDLDNQRVTLIAPVEMGQKELRYWSNDSRKILTSIPFEVTLVETVMNAPTAVETGTTFAVDWKGPGARFDELQIVDITTNKVVRTARVRSGKDNRVSIKAPDEAGEYLLRYWNAHSRAVMAVQPLSVQ